MQDPLNSQAKEKPSQERVSNNDQIPSQYEADRPDANVYRVTGWSFYRYCTERSIACGGGKLIITFFATADRTSSPKRVHC